MKNEEIISKIKAGIVNDTHTDLVKNPISINFDNDTLVMEGVVDRVSIKKRALLIAGKITGKNGGVIDRLRVKPVGKMEDLEIAEHLQDLFDQEYELEGLPIEVRAGDGIVYLDGEVHSLAHKRLAEVFAWWVPGIADVKNNLMVVPPEKDSDDEIKDTVKLVFERDKLVKDGNIVVKVKDSVVTLKGLVKSSAAVDAAEDDVWFVSGVRDVVNKLEVG